MLLNSPAFVDGQPIPKRYSCEGENISPPLSWDSVPEGTHSLALIVEDPDAPSGTFLHWLLYNVPAEVHQLPEHVPTAKTLAQGAFQGLNDFNHLGYGGPCPPEGPPHHYFFRLYALDNQLELKPGASRAQVTAAMKGHTLGTTELIGTFQH